MNNELKTYTCLQCGEKWIDLEGGSTCWKCHNYLSHTVKIFFISLLLFLFLPLQLIQAQETDNCKELKIEWIEKLASLNLQAENLVESLSKLKTKQKELNETLLVSQNNLMKSQLIITELSNKISKLELDSILSQQMQSDLETQYKSLQEAINKEREQWQKELDSVRYQRNIAIIVSVICLVGWIVF